MVTENELKWPQIEPSPGTFTFDNGDKFVQFAKDNGLLMRGHNLVWHNSKWLPDWVNNYDFGHHPRQAAEKILSRHITTEIKHYSQVISWDVINETIAHEDGKIRETVFTKAMGGGIPAVEFIYHTARAAAPATQLVYNDYMSWAKSSAVHRDGVLRFLEEMRKRTVPIDALGIQGHIGLDHNTPGSDLAVPEEKEWRAFLDEVVGMNFALLITEFDVNDRDVAGDFAARDQAVADYGKRFLDVTLSYPQVQQVLTWGIVDHHSWLQHNTPRADGKPKRPLPYDENYQAKPLREAMAAAFRAAPPRS